MLKLYYNDMSTCAQKVRFALAEKGVKWTSVHLDLRAGDHQAPEYVALNPNAVVPTLAHDDTIVIESTVINEYIDDAFDGPALRPSQASARAQMRLWTKKLDEELHADTGVLSTSIAFRFQKFDQGPAALEVLINAVPDPVKRERVRANIFDGVKSRYFQNSVRRFDQLFAAMELTLSRSPWLAGESFSLADIAYAPYVTRVDHLQLHRLWKPRLHVADWYARLKHCEGYQRALADWFNPKYLSLMLEKGAQENSRINSLLDTAA